MTLLVSKYQELNSSLMILNKMGVKKLRYKKLCDTSFCMKAKLFIGHNLPKFTKKCGSKSLGKATDQYTELKKEIAKSFDLRSIMNNTFALMKNQEVIMKKLKLRPERKRKGSVYDIDFLKASKNMKKEEKKIKRPKSP